MSLSTLPKASSLKHFAFHLVNGETIEVDADDDEVAYDGDYLAFDLPQGREVIIARRHIAFIQVREIE